MSNGLGYAKGPMGWVVPGYTEINKMLEAEQRYYENLYSQFSESFQSRPAKDFQPAIKAKWEAFQLSKGREAGSCDLTLIDEFVFGKSFTWLPQDIGSCVWSNTFRRWFERMLVEICLRGDPEEFIGKNEFGPQSLAPFCISYGFARQRANMRGGDGLYCKPMSESLALDGVVLCSTPKLKELMDKAGATSDKDYPEPRSARLYRQIGDWAWNEALKPYADCKVLESPTVTTIDLHRQNALAHKPMYQCSGIAMRKSGTHKDGFAIHTQDPSDSWSHNMGWAGMRVASDGKVYHRLCNTSWLQPNEPDKEKYIYNVPDEEVARWYSRKIIDVSTIGEIAGIESLPVSI